MWSQDIERAVTRMADFHRQGTDMIVNNLRAAITKAQEDLVKPISVKQLGWISHYVLSKIQERLEDHTAFTTSGKPFNAPVVGAEKWLKANASVEDASFIIDAYKSGSLEQAVEYLKNLGLPLK